MTSGNPLSIVFGLVDILLLLYSLVVLAWALLSWVRPVPYHPLVRLIYKMVDPVTGYIRRIIPTRVGALDLSAFILLIAIQLLREILSRIASRMFGLG